MSVDLNDKRNLAIAYFVTRWPKFTPQDREDFGSFCVEQWLRGRKITTNLQYLCLDFVRLCSRKKDKRGSKDLMAQPNRIPTSLSNGTGLYEEFSTIGRKSAELVKFEDLTLLRDPRYTERQRSALILYYDWQFTMSEIADVWGCSEAIASTTLKEATRIQKEFMSQAPSKRPKKACQLNSDTIALLKIKRKRVYAKTG